MGGTTEGALIETNEAVCPGYRSGRLKVVAEAPRLRGERAWLCRCDCGGEKIVPEHHLKSEHTKSCGCLSSRKSLAVNVHIGQLTLIAEAPKRNGYRYWHCRCDCGAECVVQEGHLKSGHTKSCGCIRQKRLQDAAYNLTGQRFGRLTAVEPTTKRRKSSVIWHCHCDCGNEAFVETESLVKGRTRSCGCLREDKRKENMQNAIHFIDGTCIEKIACQRESSANTSGHRGVYPLKNGKFRASITFRGTRYDLGTHKTFEDAVDARRKGEQKYFGEYLEEYYARQTEG